MITDSIAVEKIKQEIKKIKSNPKYLSTSNWETNWENRDNLIKTMYPMVFSISIGFSRKYSSLNIEDIFSAGIEGCIYGTELMITRHLKDKTRHKAKISTLVHPYIKKYINEFCKSNHSQLSCRRSDEMKMKSWVISGNQPLPGKEGDSNETIFSAGNDENLHVNNDYNSFYDKEVIFEKIKNKVSENNLEILKNFYGIGIPKEMSIYQIEQKYKIPYDQVENIINSIQNILRENLTYQECQILFSR